MSKFKHMHINTDINGKSKNSSKAVDKFGSKSTKNQKDKNNSFEKRKKKLMKSQMKKMKKMKKDLIVKLGEK